MNNESVTQKYNSPSIHCEGVLSKPPKCGSFREMRSWVLCRAWQIMDQEKLSTLPVGRAWDEAKRQCGGG